MSNWTHVAGIIRVDDVRFDLVVKPNFDEIIGKEWSWDSPSEILKDVEANPDKYLPMGSEGSLQMSVWENPDKNCMASYTISIFGDLRDHHSTSDIIEWFKKKCDLLWVRNAVITVENERCGTVTYTYEKGEKNDKARAECSWMYYMIFNKDKIKEKTKQWAKEAEEAGMTLTEYLESISPLNDESED